MTRLTNALGKRYEENKNKIFTRKFELGGHTFKVRVPYVHESDEMYKRINEPDAELVEALFQEMTAPLREVKETAQEFVFTDDDVLVEGRSLRLSAKQKIQVETQITEFFKLLVPEVEGESLADLTYEEIKAEFPMSVQMQMLEKISEAISPTYKETRGN
jgi:hypothetical protein